MMNRICVAFVFGTRPGIGGLGLQVRSALDGLAAAWDRVVAIGPLPADFGEGDRITSVPLHRELPVWLTRYSPLRWRMGLRQQIEDCRLGRWAAARVAERRPDGCYVFTQVGLETLRWARGAGVPTVLDSPNGHLRNFREVYCSQSRVWCDSRYLGHPTEAMVARVEEEYALADRIRVSSAWARESLVAGGVPRDKIDVVPQPIDLDKYQPAPRTAASGPLRVLFVGGMDLRKGFIYLLRAARQLGSSRVQLRFVGATGDRDCRRLLAREARGLVVGVAPGDPRPAYRWADLLVLPSLEDGFGFVVGEAMASGLPAIVTDTCGSAELVEHGVTGWIVPAGESAALAGALDTALGCRADLAVMGERARAVVEAHVAQLDLQYFGRAFAPAVTAIRG
jgi:glycosyltransferase involved in cell wall biosynthesis